MLKVQFVALRRIFWQKYLWEYKMVFSSVYNHLKVKLIVFCYLRMSPVSAMFHHHVSARAQNGEKQTPAVVSEPGCREGERRGIQVTVVCNQIARCHKVLHTVLLVSLFPSLRPARLDVQRICWSASWWTLKSTDSNRCALY